jgi:hypothetical protein
MLDRVKGKPNGADEFDDGRDEDDFADSVPPGTENRADAHRDALWQRTFNTIYDSVYFEVETATYIRRVQFVALVAGSMALITGGSGAVGFIAKEAAWQSPVGTWVWTLLIIVAVVFGVLNRMVDTRTKIPIYQRLSADLTELRGDLEEFRSGMVADPVFDLKLAEKRYKALRKRFNGLVRKCPVSLLLHERVRRACQAETDKRLQGFL